MKTIFGLKRDRLLAKISVFLIIAALIAGMVGCDGDGYTPSQNLEIRTWYDLDDVRDNLSGNHTLMTTLPVIRSWRAPQPMKEGAGIQLEYFLRAVFVDLLGL